MTHKLTPWYPPHIKPVRDGIYQTELFVRDESLRGVGYSIWHKGSWGYQHSDLEQAIAAIDYVCVSYLTVERNWRGIQQEAPLNAFQLVRPRGTPTVGKPKKKTGPKTTNGTGLVLNSKGRRCVDLKPKSVGCIVIDPNPKASQLKTQRIVKGGI